jgi:hypothetical protein
MPLTSVTLFLAHIFTASTFYFGACTKPAEQAAQPASAEVKPGGTQAGITSRKIKKVVLKGAEQTAVQTSLSSKPFKYTAKAACQIKCMKLQIPEIKEVVAKGKVVKYETKNEDLTCPLYALEHTLQGKGRVLVLTADCKDATKVVRVVQANVKCNC